MATYKLIQDIEAEDKILGPLTLRQFIFALITTFFLYLCFIAIAKQVPFFLILLIPPTLFSGFFAFPFGRDQPTEIWAVAKISFLFKPRKRIWNQSGIKELVTINVPRKVERIYTNGLSQTEVKSRLSALATTIDSRGWAIKNVNLNMYAQPALISDGNSDRLVAMSSMPQAVPDYSVQASDDILDENNNPIAQQFTQMISASTQAHRQHIIDTMNGVIAANPAAPAHTSTEQPENLWFVNNEPQVLEPASPYAPIAATPDSPTAEELALLDKIKSDTSTTQTYNSHMHTLQPLSAQAPKVLSDAPEAPLVAGLPAVVETPPPSSTDPDLLYLARSNDLYIDTLARQAQKSKHNEDPNQGEVVISLR